MKITERTGMWIEMSASEDEPNEITVQVPNSLYVGWMMPVRLAADDVAAFLESIGWTVQVPRSSVATRP